MRDDVQLAIVIPAYKSVFLEKTLESIFAQSDKRFRVYVGDDASPGDVKSICDIYSDTIEIIYHRFEDNLGGQDLVAQWERCVALSQEAWVWLFCDDDIMAPDCVSAFYTHLKQTEGQFDLYRFNVSRIDAEGNTIYMAPKHPPLESTFEFVYDKLSFQRDSFVSEYIFSREIHDKKNGFVTFPLAWCADDATWIKFGEERGLSTIPQSRVYWRQSGSNISMGGADYHTGKLQALVDYIDWLTNHFASANHIDGGLQQRFMSVQKSWFLAHLSLLAPFGLKAYLVLPRFPAVFSTAGRTSKALILLRFDFHYYINNVKQYYCALLRKGGSACAENVGSDND